MATEFLPALPLGFSQAALFGALVIVGLAAGEALRRYRASSATSSQAPRSGRKGSASSAATCCSTCGCSSICPSG
jgi:hypothetical protein